MFTSFPIQGKSYHTTQRSVRQTEQGRRALRCSHQEELQPLPALQPGLTFSLPSSLTPHDGAILELVNASGFETGFAVAWPAGDIVELDVDEGKGIYRRSSHRVFGMNAPEPQGSTRDVGLRCKLRMEELSEHQRLHFLFVSLPPRCLVPPRFKRYGRTLVRVFLHDGTELADLVIADGLAVPYFSGMGRQGHPFQEPDRVTPVGRGRTRQEAAMRQRE